MNIAAYLDRIGFSGSVEPTLTTLAALQQAHMLRIPFENLSIALHEPIILREEALFAKIVENKRGGFCYELNSLFARLLEMLGYRVTLLAAEVAHADGTFGPPYDHLTLLVELAQSWLVDVGFGDSFRQPLLLDSSHIQHQAMGSYRIIHSENYQVLEELHENTWSSQYRFTSSPHAITDFAEMCWFHQTSPESHFTRQRVCSIATPTGRYTLSDQKFIITDRNTRNERMLANADEVAGILLTYFAIRLPG